MKTALTRHLLTAILPSLAVLGGTPALGEQTQLNVGDFAFVHAGADVDTIGFVSLVDIKAGTYIHITDNARTASTIDGTSWRLTSGRLTEGLFTWVAATDIPAGTVVSLATAAATFGVDLSASGENLLAFQGTVRQPSFIGGIGFAAAGSWLTTGTPSTNNSYLPSTLTLGSTALDLGNFDNGAYNSASAGGSGGTPAALLAAINTATNWTTNDTAVPTAPSNFTVTGAASGTAAPKQLLGYSFGSSATNYSNAPTVSFGGATAGIVTYTGTGVFDSDGNTGFSNQGARVTGGQSTDAALNLSTAPYYGFSLTLDPGATFDLGHVELEAQRDTNGPLKLGLFASTDGFATSFQVGTDLDLTTAANWFALTFDDATSTALSGTIDFRVYSWAAGTTAGILDIDEVWIDGAIAVPEPASIGLLLGGLGLISSLRLRRRARHSI